MFVYVITVPINKVFYCCVKSRDNNHCGSKGTLGSLWSEISHHNSLEHTLRAIALYLFPHRSSSWEIQSQQEVKMSANWEKKNPYWPLVFLMLGIQRSIIISLSPAFHHRPLSARYMLSQGAINAGRGTAGVLLSRPGTMAGLFLCVFSSII